MERNWQLFIDVCRQKAVGHQKTANFWSAMYNVLTITMIMLSAVTAGAALVEEVPKFVLSIIGAVATVISSISSFLNPLKKANTSDEASKKYRWLMMQMAHCETEKQYDDLWSNFNKYVLKEPHMLGCYTR